MEVKRIPPAHRDVLADRHERVGAALDGEPMPPPEVPSPKIREELRIPTATFERKRGKDTLELYGHLIDQHAIVSKRLRELVTRPMDSREDSLRVIAAQLFKMMETVKEMQG